MDEKTLELLTKAIEEGIIKCLKENPDIEKEIPWFSIKAETYSDDIRNTKIN